MAKKSKTVIIGIDGVPFRLIDKLSSQGVMPFVNALKRKGVFRELKSSIPAVSSVSWSSIITGKNPGQHGIYGFTQMIPNTYAISYPNFSALKTPAFWQNKDGKKYVILNTPTTYPAQELNGCLVAGFVAPTLEKAVYPQSELEVLKKLEYQIDLDSSQAKQSELVLYNQLYQTHQKREEIAEYLWEKYQPDVFMLVMTGSDRIGHFGWEHWEDKSHLLHHKFIEYFRLVDQTIRKFVRQLKKGDKLIILSDHGMEKVNYEVNLNAYLIKGGFLKIDDNVRKKFNRILEPSKLFALEHGRLYLNRKGSYPNGSVETKNETSIIEQVIKFLKKIEIDNKPVIQEIYSREDIYQGEYLNQAPDLVVVPHQGFNLMGRLTRNFYRPSKLTGMHNENGFILTKGVGVEKEVPLEPTVEDIVELINN